MKVTKNKIYKLEKCYAIAPLRYKDSNHILVAAETQNKCLLFDCEGNLEDTVWEGPGGTMSMVQVPGGDGAFLATHKFYSPNDSKEAAIVLAMPKETGGWEVQPLIHLPFVHRFDILTVDDRHYLIACTVKSGHECEDDWSVPGKIWAARLPENLSQVHEKSLLFTPFSAPLSLTCIKEGLLKNHGYCKIREKDREWALISSDNGIFRVEPPAKEGGEWRTERLIKDAASDAVLADLDGDGEKEILAITPFHGDTIKIYKKVGPDYKRIWTCGFPMEFAHAIGVHTVEGRTLAIIGHRNGKRDLLAFWYDRKTGGYSSQVLDHNVGTANVYCYEQDGRCRFVAANRETDEIAFYTLQMD